MLKDDILPAFRPDGSVHVEVLHDSAFNRPDIIEKADVCFANCVTWPNDTMAQLATLAEGAGRRCGRRAPGGGRADPLPLAPPA